MTRIKPPTNSKQLTRFPKMINFYQDVWKRRSHILALPAKLSSKTGKLNWQWGKVEQQAFDQAKEIFCKHAMLAYPDFDNVSICTPT